MRWKYARREKLRKIVALGVDPWGSTFRRPPGDRRNSRPGGRNYDGRRPAAEGQHAEQHGPRVRAAGRIVLMRDKGKLIFIDIRDWTGQIQLLYRPQPVGEENWALAECFDLGDLIGVDGELKRTKTGELTIFVDKLHFLTKSLDPPPEKYHGLTDPECGSGCAISI